VFRAIFQEQKVRTVVLIVVNAATAPPEDLGEKPEGAWFGKVVFRGIDLMMERVAWESLDAVRERVVEFERLVRRRDPDFRVYLIEVAFDDVQDREQREYLNGIGTRLRLPPEEVQAVVKAGRELLRSGRKGDNGRDIERIRALFGAPVP
jgi:NTE family protein